ncbi:MAG: hypothetical protein K2Y30_01890 [Flavobacteriaceae bacterium]|nr:hypothetical protein [Flavobacteriaceae bacterium]
MNIYKLKYSDNEIAIADLVAKGVYTQKDQELHYGEGIQAVVEIGKIALTPGTYDDQDNIINEPTYSDGYHYDVMSNHPIDFENQITPNNPKHTFYGY